MQLFSSLMLDFNFVTTSGTIQKVKIYVVMAIKIKYIQLTTLGRGSR